MSQGFYRVWFVEEKQSREQTYRAHSAGNAFALCLKEHPEATLVKAYREGHFMDGHGLTVFFPPPQPPKIRSPKKTVRKKSEDGKFHFFDAVKSKKTKG